MFQGYKRARVLLVSETPYKPHGETGAPRPPTRPPPVGPRQAPAATRSHPHHLYSSPLNAYMQCVYMCVSYQHRHHVCGHAPLVAKIAPCCWACPPCPCCIFSLYVCPLAHCTASLWSPPSAQEGCPLPPKGKSRSLLRSLAPHQGSCVPPPPPPRVKM